MKECTVCHRMKDEWQEFTRTNRDKPYEVDICQFCRMGGIVEE